MIGDDDEDFEPLEDNDRKSAVETLAEIINPKPEPSKEIVEFKPEPEDDAEFARQAIRRAVKYAEGAVTAAGDGVAMSENNPRAVEVLVQAIKTMAENAKTLMDTKKVNTEITKTQELKDGTQVINNNLFVTPAELLRLKEAEEEKKKKDGSPPSQD
jgi:hypothetical protein